LATHLARPVLFQKQIENMYHAGARIFIEVGPRRVLSGLVDQVLADQPHVAVALAAGEPELLSFLKGIGQVASEGIVVELDSWFDHRHVEILNLGVSYVDPERARYHPTTWLVDGGRAWPWREGAPQMQPSPVTPVAIELRENQRTEWLDEPHEEERAQPQHAFPSVHEEWANDPLYQVVPHAPAMARPDISGAEDAVL
jgi:acyl transferase domain-containing protein